MRRALAHRIVVSRENLSIPFPPTINARPATEVSLGVFLLPSFESQAKSQPKDGHFLSSFSFLFSSASVNEMNEKRKDEKEGAEPKEVEEVTASLWSHDSCIFSLANRVKTCGRPLV